MSMDDMRQFPGAVEGRRNCTIIAQPTVEKRLEDSSGYRNTVGRASEMSTCGAGGRFFFPLFSWLCLTCR